MVAIGNPLGGVQASAEVEAQRMRRKPIVGDVAPAVASAMQEREDGLTALTGIYQRRLSEQAAAMAPMMMRGTPAPAKPTRPQPYPAAMLAGFPAPLGPRRRSQLTEPRF